MITREMSQLHRHISQPTAPPHSQKDWRVRIHLL